MSVFSTLVILIITLPNYLKFNIDTQPYISPRMHDILYIFLMKILKSPIKYMIFYIRINISQNNINFS